MRAAISFGEIDNKFFTFKNLNALGLHGSSSEIRDIKANELFEKYYDSNEWKSLLTQMDKRIAKLTAHHKNLRIFSHNKQITYNAIRINSKRDTVANSIITVYPMSTGCGGPATHQTQVVFQYEYTEQDSLDHIAEVQETVGQRFWLKNDTVGIIEDDNEVWMHPFRYNEFFKTEIAPFPAVQYPITNARMYERTSKIVIMKNWGIYSPTMTEQKYFYIGEDIKTYDWAPDIKCYNFEAYGHNSAHGISNLKYSFNPEYGFTEMHYETYDGDKIIFEIVNVKAI